MKLTKENGKHIGAVGGILSGVSAAAALLIGLTNLITAPTIAKNEQKATLRALDGCYSSEVYFYDAADAVSVKKSADNSHISKYWTVYSDAEHQDKFGYIFFGSGSNSYGDISLCIGIDIEQERYSKMSIITNTETYKDKVTSTYIAGFNANPSDSALEDVKCGATYAANTIKDIVEDAKNVFNALKGKGE